MSFVTVPEGQGLATKAPTQMIYNLLTRTFPGTGINITADDSVTNISPNLNVPSTNFQVEPNPASLIYLKLHPYQQEADFQPSVPLVVVGPAKMPSSKTLIGGQWSETSQTVEVRVLVRTVDDSGDGYKLTGDLTRRKILDDIRQIIKANAFNPDQQGTFLYCHTTDPGRDYDDPQGVPWYRTAMSIETFWLD